MKKNLMKYLASCSVMAFMGSCNHEAVVEGTFSNQSRTITMQAELRSNSRIAFEENETSLNLLWEENDGFSVMVGKAVQTPVTFALTEGAGTSTGMFEGKISCNDGDTLYAVWPIMENGMCGEHQCYWSMAGQKGVLDDQYTFMVGSGVYHKGESTTMSFRHMSAALRMHLELPEGVEKLIKVEILGEMLGREGAIVNIDSGGLLLDGSSRNDGVTIENEFLVVDNAVDVVAYFFAWEWTYLKNAKVVATSEDGNLYEGSLVNGNLRPGKLYDTTVKMSNSGEISQENKIQLAAKNGGEFTVTERIRLTAPLIVEKDLNLHFNDGAAFDGDIGQFVDSNSLKAMVVVKPGAALTINGNGEINTGHMDSQLSCIRMIGGSNEPSKVVINSGMLIGTHHVILVDEDCQNAQVEINGGSLSSDWSIVTNNYNGSAILNKSDAQVVIKGGHISSSASAVEMWGGQFTMTNGTLEASYQGEKSHVDTNGVADNCIVGSALALYPSEGNTVTASISNGTFQGISSIYEIHAGEDAVSSLSITGGIFEGTINSYNCTDFISGGQFKVEPNANYMAPGKVAVSTGSYYEIQDGTGEGEPTGNTGLAAVISKVYPDLVTKNTDGTYTINQDKAATVVELALSDQGTIESLDGIENFPNLERLFCDNVGLKTLDISKNQKLKQVEVNKNLLTSLNFSSNPALEIIKCSQQQNRMLTSLDVNGNTNLRVLECQENALTSLDLTDNTKLEEIDCGVNKLSNLNVANNLELRKLFLACNNLTSLDISMLLNLTDLHCTENHISDLDITKNEKLGWLNCGNQQPDGTEITVRMTEAQKELWDENWSKIEYWNSRYVNVVVVEADSNLITIQNTELSTALQAVLGAENVKLENGYAVMTKEFVESVETIEIPSGQYTITSLSGIENFINLKRLECARTGLTECNLSKNTKLESVAVWDNSLSSLDLSNQASLFDINCAQNETLQTLKINANVRLKYLIIDDTNLQSLVIPNPETIWQLAYSRTPLNLDLSQFTGLEILFCSGNKLATINLTPETKQKLTNLECDSNSLTSLDLSEYSNLQKLKCWRNLITSLDITPLNNLQDLECGNQQNDIVLQLLLTDDQKTKWESSWSTNRNNNNVRTPEDSIVEPNNGNTNGNNFWFEEL